MALDIRTAQTRLENVLRDSILLALGKRLPAVATIAALREVLTAGASSTLRTNDDLINIVVGGIVTAAYRWSSESSATDNGASVIKPADVIANGRWLSWTSDIRFVPSVGSNSYYLHELLGGEVRKAIVLDKSLSEDEVNGLILGQVPAVVIEATGDEPRDMQYSTGWRYDTSYDFKISVVCENLRDRREAAQGSFTGGDTDPGANAIDGFIKALLGGVNLTPEESGIRNIVIGRGDNYVSELGQRRVIRERSYKLLVTEENPPAANDAGLEEELTLQAELIGLHDQDEWDGDNYIEAGIQVVVDTGLTQFVTIGSALVAGSSVSYAGEVHAFSAYSDTYRDLNPNGTLTFVETALNGAEPPTTSGALRVGLSQTDGISVTSDRYIAITKEQYAALYYIPL